MKKTIAAFICCILTGISCNHQKSSGTKKTDTPTSGTTSSGTITIDTMGDIDPIADTNAISGGTLTSWGSSFPKSLNQWLDYNSFTKEIMDLQFEGLVTLHSTKNEPVGLLADSWTISDDGKKFTFHIDPKASWSDGTPVTAEDIQFYYDVMMDPKNMTSLFRVSLKRLKRPQVIDDKTVMIEAQETHWVNFWAAGEMYAFPKHLWNNVDFNKQNFEFPVVSGPYRLKTVEKNRYILLERRSDWWGWSRRYNQHKFNFSLIKYKFMEDQNKVLEAFKKGDFDVYPIYTSAIWMMKSDFESVRKGWVVKQKIYNCEPKSFQGFAFNLRRDKFKDVRVRQALFRCINRELMNEKLMFNQYFLLNSYFPDLYPNNTNPDVPLVRYDPDTARALLQAAGWVVGSDGILAKNGQQLTISFLNANEDIRHLNIYIEDLKKIGVKPAIEQLSWSSLTKRMDNHDFDMYWANWNAVRLRDPEAEWHSSTADDIATNNYPGVKDAKIDSLIELQKTEMNIDKRNRILRAIDKRLCEIVPYALLWNADHHRVLYWNKFGTPRYVYDKFNHYDCIPMYWWLDPKKNEALQHAMKNGQAIPRSPEEVHYTE